MSRKIKCFSPQSCSNSEEDEVKKFVLPMTFDVLNSTQDPQNTPFTVNLQFVVNGKVVFVHLPALNFTLPADGGSLLTIAGFIPKEIRARDAIYQSATLESDQTGTGYNLYFGDDGSIRVVAPGDQPIFPGGPQTTHAKTIPYMLPFNRAKVPVNFALSDGYSQMNQLDNPDIADQFLDWYRNAFVYDKRRKREIAAYCWADNAKTKNTPPYSLNVMTRVGEVKRSKKTGKTELKLKDPVLALEVPIGVYCAENSITINPTNPDNMFFTTLYVDRRPNPRVLQAWVGVSFDGGQHWVTRQIDVPPFPTFRSDQNALFDDFGNLWLITMIEPSPGNPNPPSNLLILLSTDGGLSFNVAFQTTDAVGDFIYDFPQLAFGGDGQGGFALWFSADYANLATINPFFPVLGYIPISATGIPNLAGARVVQLPQFSLFSPNSIFACTLTANAQGQVFMNGATFVGIGDTFVLSYMIVNPKGIAFEASDMLGPYLVNQNNTSQATFAIQFQNVRGITMPSSRGVVFDNKRGLLYAIDNDIQPARTQNMTVMLIYSENGGQSWSELIQISDKTTGDRGIVGMDLDQETGNISFNWYDARGDPTNNSVRFFGSILLGSEIDEIRGSKKRCPEIKFSTVKREMPKMTEIKGVDRERVKKLLQRRYRR